MSGASSLRRLAVLEAPSDVATVFGGQTRSWSQVAALWIDLAPAGVREPAEVGAPPTLIESASAEARNLAVASPGQRLTLDGASWRIVRVAPARPKPGRMTLTLERRWPS